MSKRTAKTRSILDTTYSRISKIVASKAFLIASFAWFFLQAAYIAFSTRFALPPDERYHFDFISHIASHSWLPFFGEQTDNFDLGEASRTPFFIYHYLFSVVFRLFADYEYAYLILRFFNIFIAIGSLILVVKIANLLSINKLVRNLSIFMMANTLMFVFLSASINYDNLFILVTLLSVYLLITLLKKPDPFKFLLFIFTLALGLLIKISFIPIAVVTVAILIFTLKGRFLELTLNLFGQIRKLRPIYLAVLVPTLILCSLLVQRYIVNYIEYKKFEPKCTQVLTLQQCEQNALFVRTQMIRNSDRPEATRSIYEFSFDWTLLIQQRTYGIFAHQAASPTPLILFGSQILLLLAVFAIIRKYDFKDKAIGKILIITGFYCLILLYTNHKSYVASGNFGFATHGRYLFGLLPLMYLIGNHYIFKLLKYNFMKILFILGVFIVFITAGLPSYIYMTDPSWHAPDAVNINADLKNFLTDIRQ